MKTGGSERKTAWGGSEEGGSVNTVVIFGFQAQSRSGVISCMETAGALTVICRPEALNNA